MVRFFLLCCLVTLTLSCKRKWSEQNKKDFVAACEKKQLNELGAVASPYCQCLLQKVMERYPNANDVGYIRSDTSVAALARQCLLSVSKKQ